MIRADRPEVCLVSIDLDEVVSPGLEMQTSVEAPFCCSYSLYVDEIADVADDPHVVIQAAGHIGPAENEFIIRFDNSGARRE